MLLNEKLILGIESSCDDTAIALVNRHGSVRYSDVISQDHIHNAFGGVYPELASRAHVENIVGLVNGAVEKLADIKQNIEAIAVTRGPGLIGSLIVGTNLAQGLALGWGIRAIGVNHLRGHLKSVDLDLSQLSFPAVVLLISGGHTFLTYMTSHTSVKILGATRDDSVGEAFDKVGRMIGLGYPAGKEIDDLAIKGSSTISFPRPMINDGYDFSFSGLKTAVARRIEGRSDWEKADIAASFVSSVSEVVVHKCRKALQHYRPNTLAMVGGVAASPILREEAKKLCDEENVKLALPARKWSTDNAAMIAYLGWDYIDHGFDTPPIPEVNLKFEDF